LAHRMTNPDYIVERVYIVSARGEMTEEKVERMRQGVVMEGDETVRARALILRKGLRTTLLRVVFREGGGRSLRRLFSAVGHPVLELRSIAIDGVHVGDLDVGKWRHLTDAEVASLRRHLDLDPAHAA